MKNFSQLHNLHTPVRGLKRLPLFTISHLMLYGSLWVLLGPLRLDQMNLLKVEWPLFPSWVKDPLCAPYLFLKFLLPQYMFHPSCYFARSGYPYRQHCLHYTSLALDRWLCPDSYRFCCLISFCNSLLLCLELFFFMFGIVL